MLFITTYTAFLAITLVSAAPINRRTASKVVNDLELMSTDTATLQSVVDTYAGTITQSLEFETAMDNLNAATKAATSDTIENPVFDTTDSTRLTGKMAIFTPVIADAIKALGAMASPIAAANFTSIVLPGLQTLQTNMDAFFVTLETLLQEPDLITVTANQATVDAAFKKTIKDLS